MADPKSWDLLGGFETCLRRITTAAGFYTDAGGYVTREPHQIPDSESALIAVVLDALDPATDPALYRTHWLATVLVVGKVGTGFSDVQIHLHRLMADVAQAFKQRQPDFPVGIQFPVFAGARPIPPVEGMKWIGAEMRFSSHVPKP